jgi:tetratricopeptide (TPR) repeat protein
LYLQRALLYAADGDTAKAESDFLRAESLGADPALTSAGLAKVHLTAGRPAEACRILDDLLRREPGFGAARLIRARARTGLNDPAGAAADYDTAIAAAPQADPELYLERAQALNRILPPRTEAALRGLEEGIARLGPQVITLQLAALELETQAGHFDAALARIQAVSASAPRKEIWHGRRADLLVRAGRLPEARQAYEEVLASIAKLPPGIRSARATTTLEAHARAALAQVQSSTPSH